mgnify:FL=1|jgi:hypothetical protein|tara:strand:- start:48 stop:278 length:231 start_codon:yes stop_codon:yes gene_type:complete
MPSYTLRNIKTKEETDVFCSYPELKELLELDSSLIQKLSTPKIIAGRSGSIRVPDGFNDLKKRIKSKSGEGNTINT